MIKVSVLYSGFLCVYECVVKEGVANDWFCQQQPHTIQTLNINLNRFIYRLTHSLSQLVGSNFLFDVLFISLFYHSLNCEFAPPCCMGSIEFVRKNEISQHSQTANTPLHRLIFHSFQEGIPYGFYLHRTLNALHMIWVNLRVFCW